MGKTINSVMFSRNGSIYSSREEALQKLNERATSGNDGEGVLARYYSNGPGSEVRSLFGIFYKNGSSGEGSITIVDTDGTDAAIEALRQQLLDSLGSGVTSANTVTDQLEALRGGEFEPGVSDSADTSVEGAKAYAYELLGTLDYADEDLSTSGSFVSKVDQIDGGIIVTHAELPSVSDTAEEKKVVISVSEDKGTIAVEKGEITSVDETLTLSGRVDGGIDFHVNIDNASIVQDPNNGNVIKVADSALTQYVGDEATIHVSDTDWGNNTKTISSLLTISSTTVTDENVKEQFNLVDASGNTIGETIKIYKDSSMVEIYIGTNFDSVDSGTGVVSKASIGDVVTDPDTGLPHTVVAEDFQYLNYVYKKLDGSYEMVKVNMTNFLTDQEFKSGVTIDNGVVTGVVDTTSEVNESSVPFLTVGADGFKVDGIKDAIDTKINKLDSVVSGVTSGSHITLVVEESDGLLVQSGFTIEENDIASQSLLDELSAKTVTVLTSTNGSIDVDQANTTDGTVEYDITTDASLIKMVGFSAETNGLVDVTEDSTVTETVKEIEKTILADEEATSAALNDLNDRAIELSANSITGISINGIAIPCQAAPNRIANITITSETDAIKINVNGATGVVNLSLDVLDPGYYD